VLRQAGRRLARKQWLIFYPLALAIIEALAFLAVYSAAGGDLNWSGFVSTNFNNWEFLHQQFFDGFALTPALAVAVFAGLAVCVFMAMLRAPLFRAIAGPGYPLAPRSWEEAAKLSLFYVFYYLILMVVPLAAPSSAVANELVLMASLAIGLLLVYADYVIVFEGLQLVPAMRRSGRLLAKRWAPALFVFVAIWLIYLGLDRLYRLYYDGANGVFLLVPFSQILVFSFVSLTADVVLIFLYERVRMTVS
jgi:hypothetical protein